MSKIIQLFFLFYHYFDSSTSTFRLSEPNNLDQMNRLQVYQTGYYQSCSSLYKSLICWGSNIKGEGNVPKSLQTAQVLQASVGRHQVCVLSNEASSDISRSLQESGDLLCWGTNENGQLAISSKFTKQNVEMVKAGDWHTCAKGRVEMACWGLNDYGQLDSMGYHVDVRAFSARNKSTCIISDERLACFGKIDQKFEYNINDGVENRVELGQNHLCHNDLNKSICVGDNEQGQLDQPLERFQMMSLSTYSNHTCGVSYINLVLLRGICWGKNDEGQADIQSLNENHFVYTMTAEKHSCFVKGRYYLKCIGTNQQNIMDIPSKITNQVYYFQGGGKFTCLIVGGILRCHGKNKDRLNKIPERFDKESENMSTGYSHICSTFIIMGLSSFYKCWGLKDKENQLINPPQEYITKHFQINNTLSSGYKFSCATVYKIFNESEKSAICWGVNDQGQLDIPSTQVTDLRSHIIQAGATHACGLNDLLTLICWGRNDQGQTTVPAHMNSNIKQVSCGNQHTCAVSKVMQGDCWGNNSKGQADIPRNLRQALSQVQSGGEFTCGIQQEHKVQCWGKGKLQPPPGQGVKARQIAVGHDHVCVLTVEQGFKCWGEDDQGQSSLS